MMTRTVSGRRPLRRPLLAATIAGLLVPAALPADAADPKHSVWTAYVTWRYPQSIESGSDKALLGEATGFDIRDSGDADLPDTMTFRCLGLFRVAGESWHGQGTCFKMDKAGNTIFYTFAPGDKFTFDGGTGKFKGIRGEGVEHVVWEHELPNGDWAGVIRHEANWRME